MAESSVAAEAPGEDALVAVYGDGVILSAGEIDDFHVLDRFDIAAFALLDVEDDTLRTRLEIEAQLGGCLEVLAVGVVAELAVFRQPERVQIALDV